MGPTADASFEGDPYFPFMSSLDKQYHPMRISALADDKINPRPDALLARDDLRDMIIIFYDTTHKGAHFRQLLFHSVCKGKESTSCSEGCCCRIVEAHVTL